MTRRYAVRTGNGSVPISTPLYGLVDWEYAMAEMLDAAMGIGYVYNRLTDDRLLDEIRIANSSSVWEVFYNV